MGGGKGGGGGASIPQFVKDAQKEIGEASQAQFDIQRPSLQSGAQQLLSIVNTGGPGARVPSIENAVNAQNAALANVQRSVGEGLERGGVGGPVADRLQRQVSQQGTSTTSAIAPGVAAPLALANISNALTSGRGAQQGFTAGLNALGAGVRTPTPSASRAAAGGNLANLALGIAGGGFSGVPGGLGIGGKGGPNQQNPFGSGRSPTGAFLRGSSGILGGGV